ncbi:LuxR C-terminal-related transcriptional regulator [Citricoccus sp. GCM10030269]|uniref:helix-turn-helix transcriptional regulator n=1 Tax=Citricoccus sp. GCM10030269 TaxID=3273388 RepID=UPI003606EB7C
METPHEATRALGTILSGRGPGGAILTGEVGDRRETIEAALADVSPERSIYRLHGSPFAAATDYGALSILLSGLAEPPAPTLHGMVRSLAEFLRPAHEPPAIVIVSHPDQIDAGTITVLTQLAQINRLTLVVHCDRPTDLPVDLAALMRSGILAGITVRPLTPTAAQSLLDEIVGGSVSRFAATILWRHSEGSVSRLRQLALDCMSSGKLRRTDACWVMAPGPLPRPVSGGLASMLLKDVPPRQRALLEMLSVCGPMRISDLIHTGYATEIDELHRDGALELRNDHSGRFAQVSAAQAAEVLAAIEPDRRREFDSTLEALDPGYLGVLRRADELVANGNVHEAVSLFTEARWTTKSRSDASSLTANRPALRHLAWAEARARIAVGDLEGAESVVQNSPMVGSASLHVLGACVALARGDLRQAQARLDLVPSEHHPELLGTHGPGFTSEAIRCRAQLTRAEVLAMSDDQSGALEIIGWLDRELSGFRTRGIVNDVVSSFERALFAESMMAILLVSGHLKPCWDVAEAVIDGRHGNAHAVQFADLVLATIEALTGRLDRAEERARRLVAQLEVVGDPHDLQLARAVTVFCRARRHDGGAVESSQMLDAQLGGHLGQSADQSLGRLGWLAELLLAYSAGDIHSDEARTARMLALADRAGTDGVYAVEFAAVASAFEFGDLRLAPRLADVAASTQTAYSGPNLLLARSVLERDQDLLIQGLEGLAAAGYPGHLVQLDSELLRDLPPQVLRRIGDSVPAVPGRRPDAPDVDADTADPVWMRELTRREREISRLVVEGKTNAMIARVSGISIRTVEGHLYQIYAKLQLKGRVELTRLAAAHASSRQVP